ncbi:MAG TPA: hypothetical protein VGI03_00215 [Verrucomicrobiae bacterium]|jgi:hypothetical protein
MKYSLALALGLLAAGSAVADTNTVASVNAAVAKLDAAANYSWTVNIQLPKSQFTPSPVNGVTEKGGYSMVSEDINGDTLQAVFKGDKAAIKGQDDWQSLAQADDQTAMMGGFLVNPGTAATEVAKILKDAGDLSADTNGVISGNFTDAGATDQMTFRGRNGNTPPPPKNAKGSLKFWLNPDGSLAKFETHLDAQVAFGQDQDPQDFEAIRTVEIHDVGTTKVTVPDGAMKALEAKAAPAK